MRGASIIEVSNYILHKASSNERNGRSYISDDSIIRDVPFVTKEWLDKNMDAIILDLTLTDEVLEVYHNYCEAYDYAYFDIMVWGQQ